MNTLNKFKNELSKKTVNKTFMLPDPYSKISSMLIITPAVYSINLKPNLNIAQLASLEENQKIRKRDVYRMRCMCVDI